jgi:hypothetical protein
VPGPARHLLRPQQHRGSGGVHCRVRNVAHAGWPAIAHILDGRQLCACVRRCRGCVCVTCSLHLLAAVLGSSRQHVQALRSRHAHRLRGCVSRGAGARLLPLPSSPTLHLSHSILRLLSPACVTTCFPSPALQCTRLSLCVAAAQSISHRRPSLCIPAP